MPNHQEPDTASGAPERGRLESLILILGRGLVEREQAVRLCLLAALAGEHSLLIGPPGTAKSELARRLHTALREGRYFERLLTRFSVPEELFGPLSIKALEDDRYERHTAGYLPDATVAFIDEVFKANSAILNALLTLLNEREFDNGAGRQRCPLVSVVGASNEVPEDEVSEAFFDRFLVRLPVAPVGEAGFRALLQAEAAWSPPPADMALSGAELALLGARATAVGLPSAVLGVLAELRGHLAREGMQVSDRRWVKILRLLRTAAASEGRDSLAFWDLLLLPWLAAPDAVRQDAVADWLVARLGAPAAFSPARLTRVVEAFEAQLQAEQQANDLDYDETGRLKMSVNDRVDDIGDAKGGAGALRMSWSRARRYGDAHVGARVRQVDELLARIDGYREEVAAWRADLAGYRAASLWLEDGLLARTEASLVATVAAVEALALRAAAARQGFIQLPRLPQDNGAIPEPIGADTLHRLDGLTTP